MFLRVFLGGPVFLQKNRALVGIAKATYSLLQPRVLLFTKISYFFDWIAYKTKLSLPTCGVQAAARC